MPLMACGASASGGRQAPTQRERVPVASCFDTLFRKAIFNEASAPAVRPDTTTSVDAADAPTT
eukprot:6434934-Prymnesium_polylepis.1